MLLTSEPNIVVPFTIHECTGYYDKNRPTWEQMEKLAIHVSAGQPEARRIQDRRGLRRDYGPSRRRRDDHDEDDD